MTMILHSLNMVQQLVASSSTYSPELQAFVYGHILYTCMAAVPDAILAGSGSTSGERLSIDPRCFIAVTTEVRTQGITQVWEAFMELPTPTDDLLVMFLDMCESWAKYAPLPQEFVRRSVQLIEMAFTGLASEHPSPNQIAAGRAALRYWIAIMEGGAWNVQQVLAASLLQRQDGTVNRKRQSSKSKKRQKEVLEERTTENQLVLAQNEVRHRGDVVCEVTMLTWNSFRPLLSKELKSIVDVDDEVQGDGPVGGVVACANACLPYLLRQVSQTRESVDLFVSVGGAVLEICSSPARAVRGFAAESLYALHEVLMDVAKTKQSFDDHLENIVVNHFFQVCIIFHKKMPLFLSV